jgi:hypothetical protein
MPSRTMGFCALITGRYGPMAFNAEPLDIEREVVTLMMMPMQCRVAVLCYSRNRPAFLTYTRLCEPTAFNRIRKRYVRKVSSVLFGTRAAHDTPSTSTRAFSRAFSMSPSVGLYGNEIGKTLIRSRASIAVEPSYRHFH